MDEIVVGIADCRVANVPGQVIVTHALGSCIGLTAYDPDRAVGGLLHFMLPDSAIDTKRGRENPYVYADTGIPLLIQAVCGNGGSKRHLIVQAAGGAQMMDPQNVFGIGKRNYQAMRQILWKAGLLLRAEAVGGMQSRTVRLEIGTGRVWLQEGSEHRELSRALPRKGATTWPTVS